MQVQHLDLVPVPIGKKLQGVGKLALTQFELNEYRETVNAPSEFNGLATQINLIEGAARVPQCPPPLVDPIYCRQPLLIRQDRLLQAHAAKQQQCANPGRGRHHRKDICYPCFRAAIAVALTVLLPPRTPVGLPRCGRQYPGSHRPSL